MQAAEIKTMRESFGLTQEDFAHELDVTFATVNRWENRKAVPSRLAQNALARFRDGRQGKGAGR